MQDTVMAVSERDAAKAEGNCTVARMRNMRKAQEVFPEEYNRRDGLGDICMFRQIDNTQMGLKGMGIEDMKWILLDSRFSQRWL
jgi:hypothetical protein